MPPPQLIAGPYHAPALRRGDQTTCLYRDAEVVITSMTTARIPWPRCRALHSRGGSGLLVDDELLRAIRTESSQALALWFGVSVTTVWEWRKVFSVGQWEPEGSRRLRQELSAKGAEAMQARGLTAAERAARRRRAKRLAWPVHSGL